MKGERYIQLSYGQHFDMILQILEKFYNDDTKC